MADVAARRDCRARGHAAVAIPAVITFTGQAIRRLVGFGIRGHRERRRQNRQKARDVGVVIDGRRRRHRVGAFEWIRRAFSLLVRIDARRDARRRRARGAAIELDVAAAKREVPFVARVRRGRVHLGLRFEIDVDPIAAARIDAAVVVVAAARELRLRTAGTRQVFARHFAAAAVIIFVRGPELVGAGAEPQQRSQRNGQHESACGAGLRHFQLHRASR